MHTKFPDRKDTGKAPTEAQETAAQSFQQFQGVKKPANFSTEGSFKTLIIRVTPVCVCPSFGPSAELLKHPYLAGRVVLAGRGLLWAPLPRGLGSLAIPAVPVVPGDP